MLDDFLPVTCRLDPFQLGDRQSHRLDPFRSVQFDFKRIRQRIGFTQFGQQSLLLAKSLLETVHRLFLGNEVHPRDARQFGDPGANLPHFHFLERILQIHRHLDLGFQHRGHVVQVHHQNDEYAENQERQSDRHQGSQTHQAVAADRIQRLGDKIFGGANLHSHRLPWTHPG